MKSRKFIAFAIALALAGTTGATTLTVNAQGLTQATDASTVVYGVASSEDVQILASMFDVEYYKENNPEVVEALGDDTSTLFQHFVLCGVFEGRTCNANFDPAAYASAYDDVKSACAGDILKAYEHYYTIGMTEGRDLTTVAACAAKGITVEPFANPENAVSPALYYLATKIGTTDFATLNKAAKAAASGAVSGGGSGAGSSSSSSQSNGGGSVVVTEDGTTVIIAPEGSNAEAYAKASGFEEIGTIKVSDGQYNHANVRVWIAKGEVGYAGYDDEAGLATSLDGYLPIFKTDDYVAGDNPKLVGDINVELMGISGSESSSSSEYDFTNNVKMDFESVSTTEEGGILVSTGVGLVGPFYGEAEIENEIVAATDIYGYNYEVVGYYTNADGTEVHTFASDEEREEWCKQNESYLVDNYNGSYEAGIDVKGTNDTLYSYGAEIVENEDGSISVSVGLYNDDNQFGYVSETSISGDTISEVNSGSNE